MSAGVGAGGVRDILLSGNDAYIIADVAPGATGTIAGVAFASLGVQPSDAGWGEYTTILFKIVGSEMLA